MKLIYALQVLKNSPDNWLGAKIIIHIANIILYFIFFFVAYFAIFILNEQIEKCIGLFCLLLFLADYLFMSSVVPIFRHPCDKNDKNNDSNYSYKADIEAATREANAPGASLKNLF